MANELAVAYVSLVPTTKGISAAVAREMGAPVATASSKAGKSAGARFSSGFKSAMKVGALGVGIVGIAAASVIKDAVQLEAAFSKTMAQVAVASRAPKAELKELDRLALKLGASTVFSANEAADAMLSLAKGGLTPAQIQAGALSNTLTLATAGELELGAAADTVVKTMGAFQLGAKDTGAAVSALAGAANASSASVSDISQSLAQAGTEAHASGLSVQETTGILAAFADAGIQGSDAGTSLRTMLGRLVPQTDKAKNAMQDLGLKFTTANGEFVGAEQIAQRLQDSFEGLSAAERSTALTTIFGSDSRRAANILISEGADGLAKYIKQTSDLDQAQKLANASMSGTAGALEAVSGAVETAQLKLGRALAPVVVDLSKRFSGFLETAPIQRWSNQTVDGVTAVVRELAPLAKDLYAIGRDALPILIDAGGTTVDILKAIADIARPLVDAFAALPEPVRNFALAFGAIAWSGIAGKMTAVGGALSDMVLDFRTAPNRMRAVASAAKNLAGPAGLAGLVIASQQSNDAVKILGSTASGALLGFSVGGPIGAAIGAGVGGLFGLAQAFTGTGDAADAAVPPIGTYTEALNQLTGATTRATRGLAAQELEAAGLLEVADKFGISGGTLVDAVVGSPAVAEQSLGRIDTLIGQLTSRMESAGRAMNDLDQSPEAREAAHQRGLALKDQIAELEKLRDAVAGNRTVLQGDIESQKRRAAAVRGVTINLGEYRAAMQAVPSAVRTQIQQLGMDVAKSDIFNLAKQYELAPGKVTTLIEALGWKVTYGNINRLNHSYELTPKQVVTLVKESGVDLTARQVNDLFRDYDRLPPQIVTFLKQSGADDVLRDVRRMRDGVNSSLDGIRDEPVSVTLNAQANKVMDQLSRFGFELGGQVPGVDRGHDSVPAMLRPGEHVFTVDDVKKAGGQRVMYGIRRMIQRGEFGKRGDVSFFNDGGAVLPHAVGVTGLSPALGLVSRLVQGVAGVFSKGLSKKLGKLLTMAPVGSLGPGGVLTMAQLARGQAFARTQVGKPYLWTGVGPYGYDCSGFQSAVLNAAMGRYPYSRLGSTGTMPWSGSSPGVGRYTIGWFTGDPGHTSGNIGGLGVESSGGVGVRVGSSARSPLDGMFNGVMHYDTGGRLKPGYTLAHNGTGRDEYVMRISQQMARQSARTGGSERRELHLSGPATIEVNGAQIDAYIRGTAREEIHDEFAYMAR